MSGQQQGHGRQPNESTPLVGHKKKSLRRIYKCLGSSENLLQDSLLIFGPIYCNHQSSEGNDDKKRKEDDDKEKKENEDIKERAWKHVLEKSPGREAITTEIYLSAIRRIEGKAREKYAPGTLDHLTGSQFRWTMIKDGCLFLQMVLFILGRSEQLGYPLDDEFFGKKHNSKERKGWIQSMFFVGNQIPFMVLQELMKQTFFQDVISGGKWNDFSSNLSKKVFYEFLVLPALEIKNRRTSSKRVHWKEEQPVDLIHALQMLVLGPRKDGTTEEEAESEDEAENERDEGESVGQQMQIVINVGGTTDDKSSAAATETKGESGTRPRQVVINIGLGLTSDDKSRSSTSTDSKVESVTRQIHVVNNEIGTSDDRSCPSATELKQQGLHFEVCSTPTEKYTCFVNPIKAFRYWRIDKGVGSRGTTFVDKFSAALFLPKLTVDYETEILLRCLKNYEMSQPLDEKEREFGSYLRFMSELVRTPEDANLLYNSKKIIDASHRYREKLPRILGELASKEKYNHYFRALTVELSDYKRPTWKSFEYYVLLIAFLTVVQTVYTVLAFHKGK